ncbi:hypothetical protein O6H91_01G125600 [Diphasiastrum complanatum]|uniref:Uncharacterized protein n=1 Tax=Diphasiastrum complanatum TaxID=34168 RepID=A0ACC2EVT6_DIPCM|nr:hypothetical protein O6H91_01G125600 [Diphasiastrum complanatum]
MMGVVVVVVTKESGGGENERSHGGGRNKRSGSDNGGHRGHSIGGWRRGVKDIDGGNRGRDILACKSGQLEELVEGVRVKGGCRGGDIWERRKGWRGGSGKGV